MCIVISLVLLIGIVQSVPLASDDVEDEQQILEEDGSPTLKAGDELGDESNDHEEIIEDDQGITEEREHPRLRAEDEEADESNDREEITEEDQGMTEEGGHPIWMAEDEEQDQGNDYEEAKRGHYFVRPRKLASGYRKHESKPWYLWKRGMKYGGTGIDMSKIYSPESKFQLSPEFQEFIYRFEK